MTTARLVLCAALVLVLLDLFAGFVWLGMGSAAAPQSVGSLKDAIQLHDTARDGDKSALQPAIKALRRLRREDPWDAESAVYLGSAYAIAARDGWFGPSQLIIFARAIHHLNAALDFAPDNFEVRLVRASAQSQLPRVLGRRGAAIRDGIALNRIFLQTEDPDTAMATAMLPIYEFLATTAPDSGDWDKGWRKASDTTEDAS